MSKNPMILIVDTDTSFLKKIETFLKGEDFEPITAKTGVEAMKILESQPVDIVVTEIQIPLLDGLGLLKYVKKYKSHVEVLLMTSLPDLNSAIEAVRHKAWDYLLKPFHLQELKNRIEKALISQKKT